MELPPEKTLFRPSRMNYPGSRSGPKTRYDLPQRHKAYGNGDETETILYNGTSLQPQGWQPHSQVLDTSLTEWASKPGAGRAARALVDTIISRTGSSTPRGAAAPRVFGDTARSVLHPYSARNLPELPLLDEKNEAHGILVLGGKSCGRTSLVMSMHAVATGAFASRYDAELQEKRKAMTPMGQHYELPEREVRLGEGSVKSMKVVLTDTPPCGTTPREEQPLCSHVSPNSTQSYNAIPSWIRVSLRGSHHAHYAVLFVIDGAAMPLWEDHRRCRDLARLLSVLRKNQYTVCLAVTKLLQVRTVALRDAAHGADHKGVPGKDPRSSYEAFVGRYLERIVSALQSKADENDWSFNDGTESPPFPRLNSTIFDVPTCSTVGEHRAWQEKRGTAELPNFRYMSSQLSRLLAALCIRSHPE